MKPVLVKLTVEACEGIAIRTSYDSEFKNRFRSKLGESVVNEYGIRDIFSTDIVFPRNFQLKRKCLDELSWPIRNINEFSR